MAVAKEPERGGGVLEGVVGRGETQQEFHISTGVVHPVHCNLVGGSRLGEEGDLRTAKTVDVLIRCGDGEGVQFRARVDGEEGVETAAKGADFHGGGVRRGPGPPDGAAARIVRVLGFIRFPRRREIVVVDLDVGSAEGGAIGEGVVVVGHVRAQSYGSGFRVVAVDRDLVGDAGFDGEGEVADVMRAAFVVRSQFRHGGEFRAGIDGEKGVEVAAGGVDPGRP